MWEIRLRLTEDLPEEHVRGLAEEFQRQNPVIGRYEVERLGRRRKPTAAEVFLKRYLPDTPVERAAIFEAAARKHITPRMLYAAKARLGIVQVKGTDDPKARWWAWPWWHELLERERQEFEALKAEGLVPSPRSRMGGRRR